MSFSLGTLLFGDNWNRPITPNKEDDAAAEKVRVAARNEMTWRAPLSEAVTHDGKLVVQVDERVREKLVRVVPMHNVLPATKEAFVSTAASRWSTAEPTYQWRRKTHLSFPIEIERTASGKFTAVRFNRVTWKNNKELVAHWRWLSKNPQLVWHIIMRSRKAKEHLRDSALFI